MKALVVMTVLLLGSCQTTGGPVFQWPGVTTPPVTTTQRLSLAETERYYQAAMTAVGEMLATNAIRPGSARAQLLGNAIKNARYALDTWHIDPNNSVYAAKAREEMSTLSSLIRQNGGVIKGSMG